MFTLTKLNEFILNEEARITFDTGEFELKDTDPLFAIEYLKRNGFDVFKIIPDFEKNFFKTRKLFKLGHTKRKDMPRLTKKDVIHLKQSLESGELDINKPFSTETNPKNPFPEGLKGEEGEKWLKQGLHDGNSKDDIIPVKKCNIPVDKLKPIQEQIYLDQCLSFFLNYKNLSDVQEQITDRIFLCTQDNFILDGNHRLCVAGLMGAKFLTPCFVVDLPLAKLLPLTLSFSDAIGAERNK